MTIGLKVVSYLIPEADDSMLNTFLNESRLNKFTEFVVGCQEFSIFNLMVLKYTVKTLAFPV